MTIERFGEDPNVIEVSNYPVGALASFGGSTAPDGFVFCDGSVYNASTNPEYQPLYDVIGNTYGGTDNTDFEVPDLRGRLPAGNDNMGGTSANRITNAQADTIGGVMGEELHTFTEAELDQHLHTLSTVVSAGVGGSVYRSSSPVAVAYTPNTGNTGSNTPFNVVQPTLFTPWVIKL